MTKTFNLCVNVTTTDEMSGDLVAHILKKLIDAGLADAQRTIEYHDGDLQSAKHATDLNISNPAVIQQETSIKVKHWAAYGIDATVDTHQFDINDHRETNGQAYMTLGALEGPLDDMLSVTVEVNTNPLNGIDHVPCANVYFDGDTKALSIFKIGDQMLVRPETDVSVQSFVQNFNGTSETLYWIK